MAAHSSLIGRLFVSVLAVAGMYIAPAHAAKSDAVNGGTRQKNAVSLSQKKASTPKMAASTASKGKRVVAVTSRRQVHRTAVAHAEIRSVAKPTFGQLAGLHQTADSLGLKSNAVMVLDQQTHEVLFDKNAKAVLPIASLTKVGGWVGGALNWLSGIIPKFDVGTDYVPRDMIAQIHKGERIVPAAQNNRYGEYSIVVNVVNSGGGSVAEAKRSGGTIAREVLSVLDMARRYQ